MGHQRYPEKTKIKAAKQVTECDQPVAEVAALGHVCV